MTPLYNINRRFAVDSFTLEQLYAARSLYWTQISCAIGVAGAALTSVGLVYARLQVMPLLRRQVRLIPLESSIMWVAQQNDHIFVTTTGSRDEVAVMPCFEGTNDYLHCDKRTIVKLERLDLIKRVQQEDLLIPASYGRKGTYYSPTALGVIQKVKDDKSLAKPF
jgi:hypothetical protein